MRGFVVGLVVLVGCYAAPPAQLPKRRPLVTDAVPYGASRAQVRAWFERNDWCARRRWASTDEFVICDPRPYLNRSTPPMYTLARYADDRVVAYAVFTPVPCRMYGRCDRVHDGPVLGAESDFVDHERGLRESLVQIAMAGEPHANEMPPMQQRLFDALARELHVRFGTPGWDDPRRFGRSWATGTAQIGLVVAGDGHWIAETHELRGLPPGMQ